LDHRPTCASSTREGGPPPDGTRRETRVAIAFLHGNTDALPLRSSPRRKFLLCCAFEHSGAACRRSTETAFEICDFSPCGSTRSQRQLAIAMLLAAREELVSDTRVQMLGIRARELDWLMNNSRLVAQLSALIAGYGYTALIYTKYLDDPSLCDRNDPLCAEMTYPLCVTITMGFSMFSLFGAMLITLLAPALALRGPEGSLNLCVDMALQEYTYTLLVFGVSVLMLCISTIVWSMTRANADVRLVWAASIITLMTLTAVVLIISTSMRAVRRFDIPHGSRLVTGRFDVREAEREEERLRLAALSAMARHSTRAPPQPSSSWRMPTWVWSRSTLSDSRAAAGSVDGPPAEQSSARRRLSPGQPQPPAACASPRIGHSAGRLDPAGRDLL
jgi:hypothetical protein